MGNIKSANKYVVGLDIGQQNDYTVLSILEIMVGTTGRYLYVLRHLKKFPLKMDYPTMVSQVSITMKDSRLASNGILVADYTGVGRPIVDLFRRAGVRLVAATITGGAKHNWANRFEVSVPKKDLIFCLQVVLQNGNLVIPERLKEIQAIKAEFFGFRAKISSSGRTKYEAETEKVHDDIIMSICLAVWYGENALRGTKKARVMTGY